MQGSISSRYKVTEYLEVEKNITMKKRNYMNIESSAKSKYLSCFQNGFICCGISKGFW